MSDSATSTDIRTAIKPPSMWKVILHNDDFTPMDFVVYVLVELFQKDEDEATRIMLAVHEQGRATVGLFTKEVAMTKVMMATRAAEANGHPLKTTTEEA